MKKLLSLLLACLLLPCLSASADIQAGYVVVTNPEPSSRLHLRESPSRSAKSLGMYMNGVIAEVLSESGDWVQVRIGSGIGSRTGYMMSDFLSAPDMRRLVPAMVQTEVQVIGQTETQSLYGFDADGFAVEIARLRSGTPVTVLGVDDTHAHIQFGGVTGFIHLAAVGMGSTKMMSPIVTARLSVGEKHVTIDDTGVMATLTTMLNGASARGYRMSGCPFTARLTLWLDSGETVELDLATDSCCIFRYNGYDYRYPGADNSTLFALFGISLW